MTTVFSSNPPREIETDQISETPVGKDWRGRIFAMGWAVAVVVATGAWCWFIVRIALALVSWPFE